MRICYFILCDKCVSQKQIRKNGFISFSFQTVKSTISHRSTQDRDLSKNHKHFITLVQTSSTTHFLTKHRPTCLKKAQSIEGRVLLSQWTAKEMSYRQGTGHSDEGCFSVEVHFYWYFKGQTMLTQRKKTRRRGGDSI